MYLEQKNEHLKIITVSELKKDKNGREYAVITVKPCPIVNGKEVISSAKQRKRFLWAASSLEDGKIIQASSLWTEFKQGLLKPGEVITGSIYRFDTTKYLIDGKEVESFTTVVFEDENPTTVANNQLKKYKACVIYNGVITDEKVLENNKLVNQTES